MSNLTTSRVVVGVDGRPGSAGALRYAVTEARRREAPLHLVHVVPDNYSVGPLVPWNNLRGIGADILDQEVDTARRLAPDLTITSELALMDRSGGIVKAAESAQLVVVGRETRRGLDRLLTGTTTAKVAASAACEVVVVPSFWVDDHRHGHVVVGVKSSHNNRELLSQAFSEAAAQGALLTAVVAWQLPTRTSTGSRRVPTPKTGRQRAPGFSKTSPPIGARPTRRSRSKRGSSMALRHGCCSRPAGTVICSWSRADVSRSRRTATSAAWSTTCCGSATCPCSWCPSSLTEPRTSKTWCSKRKASRSSDGAHVGVAGDHRRARQAVRGQIGERPVDFREGVFTDVEVEIESRCEA